MQKSARQKRIEQGLCARCGKTPPSNNTKLCETCRDYHKNYAAKEWQNEDGKQKRRARLKKWQKSNPEKVNARSKADYHKAREKVFDHYGRVCKCCGDKHPEFLTIDHINNDGNKERKNQNYARNFYKIIVSRKFPNNLQTLCWNCNLAKGIYGKCPHENEHDKVCSEH